MSGSNSMRSSLGCSLTWLRSSFAAALVLAVLATPAIARPAIDYRGTVLTSRQIERLAAPVLDLPADSTRVPAMLGTVVGELQARGYLDARATAVWEGDHERLVVRVTEGERYRIGSIQLHAPAGPDSQTLAAAIALAPGALGSPTAVGRALEQALATVSEAGHPYATLGVRSWEADSGRVRLGLTGSAGPLVTIQAVRFEGLKVTRASLAEKAMSRVKGRPYNRASALAARERLLALGLFRDVQLEGLEGEADWSRGRLVYRVDEPRYNRFEGALGMQGEAGPVGLVRLDLDNLLGTGRALGLRWESRGRGVTQLGARVAEPLVFGTPLRIEGSFDQNVQDTLYVRTRFGARGKFAISGTEHLEAAYEEERVVQERGLTSEARLRTTSVALERGTLDRPLAPRHGTRIRIGAGETRKTERRRPTGNASARAGSFELEAEWHRPLGASSGLAIETIARGRFSSERVLPLFERLPLGGARSLRGHDEEEFRVDRYALARLEWRWFLGDGGQRIALFWDHARAATRIELPEGGDRTRVIDADGVGFGLRLEAGESLIGLDYGLVPGRPPLEGKIHLQLVSAF